MGTQGGEAVVDLFDAVAFACIASSNRGGLVARKAGIRQMGGIVVVGEVDTTLASQHVGGGSGRSDAAGRHVVD